MFEFDSVLNPDPESNEELSPFITRLLVVTPVLKLELSPIFDQVFAEGPPASVVTLLLPLLNIVENDA